METTNKMMSAAIRNSGAEVSGSSMFTANLTVVATMPNGVGPQSSAPATGFDCSYNSSGVGCQEHKAPAPSEIVLCSDVSEGNDLQIACALGQVVKEIRFAAFGMPQGSCKESPLVGQCHAKTTRFVLEDLCVGKNKCEVPATREMFGDPCAGHAKRLLVTAVCTRQHIILDDPIGQKLATQLTCPAGRWCA